MSKEPKTPEYTRRAIRAYRRRGVQKQITMNPNRDDEAQLIEAINSDQAQPFSTLVKRLLMDHYNIKKDDDA